MVPLFSCRGRFWWAFNDRPGIRPRASTARVKLLCKVFVECKWMIWWHLFHGALFWLGCCAVGLLVDVSRWKPLPHFTDGAQKMGSFSFASPVFLCYLQDVRGSSSLGRIENMTGGGQHTRAGFAFCSTRLGFVWTVAMWTKRGRKKGHHRHENASTGPTGHLACPNGGGIV